ncbi:hypothetical protein AAVH_34648 [Aphelenchoides avenae]|nr:hypothetical protein AAVH_34648 [Aphelenchus avenae]
MLGPPLMVAVAGPMTVFIWNRGVRKVQDRLLRMIARQPIPVIGLYTFSAFCVAQYVRAQTTDKYFTRDGGIVQLVEKYQRDASNEGAKSDEATNEFVYHLDDTRGGATSGATVF